MRWFALLKGAGAGMTEAVTVQLIGIAAAVASTTSFAPQAWKIIKTRDVKGLSAPMYLITVA